jgi:hypothetical protein
MENSAGPSQTTVWKAGRKKRENTRVQTEKSWNENKT